jgi:hypothetical protein
VSAHDQLKAAGITPTIDAEKAYQLGYAVAMTQLMTEAELQHKPANGGKTPGDTPKPRYN